MPTRRQKRCDSQLSSERVDWACVRFGRVAFVLLMFRKWIAVIRIRRKLAHVMFSEHLNLIIWSKKERTLSVFGRGDRSIFLNAKFIPKGHCVLKSGERILRANFIVCGAFETVFPAFYELCSILLNAL
jgi:hypothetical protein